MVRHFRQSLISYYIRLTSHTPLPFCEPHNFLICEMGRPPPSSQCCKKESPKNLGQTSQGAGLPGATWQIVKRAQSIAVVGTATHFLSWKFFSLFLDGLQTGWNSWLLGFLLSSSKNNMAHPGWALASLH